MLTLLEVNNFSILVPLFTPGQYYYPQCQHLQEKNNEIGHSYPKIYTSFDRVDSYQTNSQDFEGKSLPNLSLFCNLSV